MASVHLRGWSDGTASSEAAIIRVRIGGERPTEWHTVATRPQLPAVDIEPEAIT
jgi:hypothetical protein